MATIHMLWDDCALTVYPAPGWLREELTYVEKTMEPDPRGYGKKSVRRKVQLYLETGPSQHKAVQTYQGLKEHLEKACHDRGIAVQVYDLRKPFPPPRLDLTHGFRFGQQALLFKALRQNRSGLLVAPTRYGKTALIKNTIRAFPGLTTVVMCPGADLVRQLYEDIKKTVGKDREVKLLGAGSRNRYQSETGVTVTSMDSAHLCEPSLTELMLVDEPHMSVTNSRVGVLHGLHRARRIGYGATVEERYDNRGMVIRGLLGPVLAEKTFREAVEEGAIAPMRAFILRKQVTSTTGDRTTAYRRELLGSGSVARTVSQICREVLPPDWQTILFIADAQQADFYLDALGGGTIAMAKRMTNTERKELMGMMVRDEVKRCLATAIYATGVTFNHVRAVFNLAGGGPYAATLQKPGRVAEVRPGKRCGVMFDFLFEAEGGGYSPLVRDAANRIEMYEQKGYDVTYINNMAELKRAFAEHCI